MEPGNPVHFGGIQRDNQVSGRDAGTLGGRVRLHHRLPWHVKGVHRQQGNLGSSQGDHADMRRTLGTATDTGRECGRALPNRPFLQAQRRTMRVRTTTRDGLSRNGKGLKR